MLLSVSLESMRDCKLDRRFCLIVTNRGASFDAGKLMGCNSLDLMDPVVRR